MKQDKLIIGGHEFDSRFILGSGKYSLDLINAAVQNAGAQIITLALRRTNTNDTANILDYIPEGVTLLPNTSGARNAEEAVRIARLAREVGSLRLKLFMILNICFQITMKRSRQQKSLPKKDLLLCHICIQT